MGERGLAGRGRRRRRGWRRRRQRRRRWRPLLPSGLGRLPSRRRPPPRHGSRSVVRHRASPRLCRIWRPDRRRASPPAPAGSSGRAAAATPTGLAPPRLPSGPYRIWRPGRRRRPRRLGAAAPPHPPLPDPCRIWRPGRRRPSRPGAAAPPLAMAQRKRGEIERISGRDRGEVEKREPAGLISSCGPRWERRHIYTVAEVISNGLGLKSRLRERSREAAHPEIERRWRSGASRGRARHRWPPGRRPRLVGSSRPRPRRLAAIPLSLRPRPHHFL
ncbi:hypothetical protein DAI22_08g108400 [Oryza sativa Japonica Group]|nr:hypothetical protein DAI22_08g108400 [Oryza sativa Japonica Group]